MKIIPYKLKKVVSRVHNIHSLSEFELLLRNYENRLLVTLFYISRNDQKPVKLLKDLSLQPNFNLVEFALVEPDLNPDIQKIANLDAIVPELRFYKGKEIVLKHNSNVTTIIREIRKHSQECLGWFRSKKTNRVISKNAKTITVFLVSLVGGCIILGSGFMLKVFYGAVSSQPPSHRCFNSENNSLFVPTRPKPEKIQIIKIDGSVVDWPPGTIFDSYLFFPKIPVPLLFNHMSIKKIYKSQDSWRKDIIDCINIF